MPDVDRLVEQARELERRWRATFNLDDVGAVPDTLAALADAVEQLQRERDAHLEGWQAAAEEANRLLPLLDAANIRALDRQAERDEARRLADVRWEIAGRRLAERDAARARLDDVEHKLREERGFATGWQGLALRKEARVVELEAGMRAALDGSPDGCWDRLYDVMDDLALLDSGKDDSDAR